MAVTLHQLYRPPIIRRLISTIKTPTNRMQDWLGMGPGGSATEQIGGYETAWDIMDRSRAIATGRARIAGPATVSLSPVGRRSATLFRSFEKFRLLEDEIFRMTPMGRGWDSPLDIRGETYVRAQQRNFIQRFRNLREYQIVQMFKGGLGQLVDGDDVICVAKGAGTFDVDFGIPVEHVSPGATVDYHGIFGHAWQTITTDVPGELMAMNAKAEELHGYPIRHVWLNSKTAMYVLNNTPMQTLAGSANSVFQRFQPDGPPSVEGIPSTEFVIVLRGLPHLTFHVYDAGLNVNGTFTKFFPDDYALFLPDPSPDIFAYREGSEIIRRNVVDSGFEGFGFNMWATPVIDPAGFEQKALQIGLPIPYIPNAILYMKVANGAT